MSNSLQSRAFNRSLGTPMLFAALEPALQERLRTASPARRYADRQFLQHRGDRADGFWLIEEGTVRVGRYLPDGEFRAVALLGPGDSYGELALFAATPRVVDALSRGESRVRFIEGGLFLRLLADCPASSRALLGALSEQLQDTLAQLAGLRRGTSPQRLAAMLVNMTSDEEGNASVSVTQQELAELLGVTRATANAALGELARRRLVERGYGRIGVPDRDRLSQFAMA